MQQVNTPLYVKISKRRRNAMDKVMFSSNSNEWATPQEFFDALDARYHFTLDPCATKENAKCKKFYTIAEDGLLQDWGGECVFCNPPYGRDIAKWVEKAYNETKKPNTKVVMLIPARTDTSYWHEWIFPHATHIDFVRGRIKFGNSKNPAPFPSAVVEFQNTDY